MRINTASKCQVATNLITQRKQSLRVSSFKRGVGRGASEFTSPIGTQRRLGHRFAILHIQTQPVMAARNQWISLRSRMLCVARRCRDGLRFQQAKWWRGLQVADITASADPDIDEAFSAELLISRQYGDARHANFQGKCAGRRKARIGFQSPVEYGSFQGTRKLCVSRPLTIEFEEHGNLNKWLYRSCGSPDQHDASAAFSIDILNAFRGGEPSSHSRTRRQQAAKFTVTSADGLDVTPVILIDLARPPRRLHGLPVW